MAVTLEQVEKIVGELAGVVAGARWGNRTWLVNERGFAWERPFSKADLGRFGAEPPPQGPILAVGVANLDAKDALLAIAPPGFFTIPHFNGFPAVLIELRAARVRDVRAAIVDAWRVASEAPPRKPRKPRATSASRPGRPRARASRRA